MLINIFCGVKTSDFQSLKVSQKRFTISKQHILMHSPSLIEVNLKNEPYALFYTLVPIDRSIHLDDIQ